MNFSESQGFSCLELCHILKGFAPYLMPQNRAHTPQKMTRRTHKESQNVSKSFHIIFLSIFYLTPTYAHRVTWSFREPRASCLSMGNSGKTRSGDWEQLTISAISTMYQKLYLLLDTEVSHSSWVIYNNVMTSILPIDGITMTSIVQTKTIIWKEEPLKLHWEN